MVGAINGATRMLVTVTGLAGHAGCVPMELRRDAVAAAAEMILAIEARAKAEADLVATVGRLEVEPGAVNVIPGPGALLARRAQPRATNGAAAPSATSTPPRRRSPRGAMSRR